MRVPCVGAGPRPHAIMAPDVAHSTGTLRRRRVGPVGPDGWLALAVFLTLGTIYVATLLPGLGGTEDTPKFQYVGATLGTPHDPGYPLYMIACWVFSKLPVGTLAYRINLLSAFWGATACALVFLAMRRLAVARWIACCVAVGLGLGCFFWQHSTFAEAYTQVSAFTAAAILALLVWDQEGRERWLYAAVAATSLAFGTHLIIVGAIPAFAWFVLTRYHWRVPLRVLGVFAVIVTLGVSQYGYVWLRTVQHARYLESRANSIAEVFEVMRGRQFKGQTFSEPPLVVARTRIPEVARAAREELGALAIIGAVVGLCATWRSRRRVAVLLAGGFAGCAVLLAMLGPVATEGIQLPSIVPCWILAGTGFAFAWTKAETMTRGTRRTLAATAVLLAVAAVPLLQARDNYDFNNRRHDTYETDYFAALFRDIEGPTAFVDEDYTLGHFLEYSRYTTGRSGLTLRVDPDPTVLAGLLRDGYAVYCFRGGLDALAGYVRYRAVTLFAPSLDARLQQLEKGRVVVVAGVAANWPSLNALRLAGGAPKAGGAVVVALNGVGPVTVTPPGFSGVLELRAGEPIGRTGRVFPATLRIEVAGDLASIAVDGRPALRSRAGLVVAEIGSQLMTPYALRPGNGFRPELDMTRRPLYRIEGVSEAESCTSIGDGTWKPLVDPGISGRLVGRIDNYKPFDSTWVLYLHSSRPLAASLESWRGTGTPGLTVESWPPGTDSARLRQRLADDQVSEPEAMLGSSVVTRLAVGVNGLGGSNIFRITLGGRAFRGWGRAATDRHLLRRASVCGEDMEPLVPDLDEQQASVYLGPGGERFFADGWHGAEPVPGGFYRRADAPAASLLLPIAQAAAITLRMSVEPLGGARVVTLVLNGRRLAGQVLSAGWNDLAWPAEAPAWRAGVNELLLEISGPAAAAPPGAPVPALRVRGIALEWPGGR
jgi:hypothetical protein